MQSEIQLIWPVEVSKDRKLKKSSIPIIADRDVEMVGGKMGIS